jgi:hypothetical protein
VATPESKVKEKVKAVLQKHGAYWHCPVQNGFGAPSLDFVCCYNGLYFAVETKAAGKKMTPRQVLTTQQIEKAGGKVFLIDGDTGELEAWLGNVKSIHAPCP